jgi:hypothetical protein
LTDITKSKLAMDSGMSRATLESAVLTAMDSVAQKPMQWGEDDCALWVANALWPVLGYDPAAKVRGRYKTRRGSQRVAGRGGLLNQLRSISRRHEWQRIDPALAQAGDVGLAWTMYDGKPVLATVICRARGWFVGRADFGFTAMRANKVVVAWSVLCDALPGGPGPRVNIRALATRPVMVPTSAAMQEPISTFIGLTAIFEAIGFTTAVAGAIGGAIVVTALSQGVSFQPKAAP